MKEDDFSYENLKKLVYIDNIQKETTRFYGPANGIASRVAVEDHNLKGVPIKKNAILGAQPLGNHYSEKYYKNPTEFRPERWESECDGNHSFAIGGFGGGARTCIGKHLARLESKIGLIKVLKRYSKIELPVEKIRFIVKTNYQPEDLKVKLTRAH